MSILDNTLNKSTEEIYEMLKTRLSEIDKELYVVEKKDNNLILILFTDLPTYNGVDVIRNGQQIEITASNQNIDAGRLNLFIYQLESILKVFIGDFE